MFGNARRIARLEKLVHTLTKLTDIEETREQLMQQRFDNLNERVKRLEDDYQRMLVDVRRLIEKADKYDNSVNQAMNMLRKIPGIET